MELSSFGEANFSAVDWMNGVLDGVDTSDAVIESTANETAFKLQLFIQQLSISLQDTAFQIHQRAGLLQKLQRDFDALKNEMILKNGVILQELEGSKSAIYLDLLDTIKTRMEEAESALKEADSWSVLVSDVESLFQSNNMELLVDRVCQLDRSLSTLKTAPDYQQKSITLERIKNRLEASMAPRLVTAVNSMIEEDAARWFTLFAKINLEKQALNYYQGCIKTRLQELWASQNHSNFNQALVIFNKELTSECEKQLCFIEKHLTISGEESELGIVSDLASEIITSLEPPLQETFETWLGDQPDTLEGVLSILEIQKQLAVVLERVMCLDNEENRNLPQMAKLAGTLFTFLRSMVSRYGQLLEQQISRKLQSTIQSRDESANPFTNLQELYAVQKRNADKMFNMIFDAEVICHERTQTACYPGFLDAASKILKTFIDSSKKDISMLLHVAEECANSIDHWDLVNEALQRVSCITHYKKQVSELCTKIDVTISRIPYMKNEPHGILSDLVSNLLTPSLRQRFKALITSKPQMEWLTQIDKLHNDTLKMAVKVISSKVNQHVKSMQPSLRVAEKTPNFASAPLECITQIGQYLLTLPQYMEISSPNSPVGSLETSEFGAPPVDVISPNMLELTAKEVTNVIINQVMQIAVLGETTSNQLAIDLAYLCDVFEDLGLIDVGQPLQELRSLLLATPEEFATVSKGKPVQIVHTIKSSRRIP